MAIYGILGSNRTLYSTHSSEETDKMGYKYLKAETIGDVLNILQKLKEEGYDMKAKWNGFDDGSLNIHPEDHKDWVSIEAPY